MLRPRILSLIASAFSLLLSAPSLNAQSELPLDLTTASIVVRQDAPLVERTAATVLTEEIEKRSGIRIKTATEWPQEGISIALISGRSNALHGVPIPKAAKIREREGYTLHTLPGNGTRITLWVVGADPRGALFGVGKLLRCLEMSPGRVQLNAPLHLTSSPDLPIRGHQLGYRATANSYDAWTPAQFDQYIRDLALFGTNSIEGIPFHDRRPVLADTPRETMNVELSRICQKYGQNYWIWVPADFDLKDTAKRSAHLQQHEKLFADCPELSGVFVPGGDPGDNPAELVIPYLRDLWRLLRRKHPDARVWLSMQGYSPHEQDVVYRWIETERPKWLGGIVAGPGSPPLQQIRTRLPKEYALRDYPDITHTVRCQFPVPWWDPAFGVTEGRECVNPRPTYYGRILHDTAHFTDGFITYSDGVHDDLNKVVWSAVGWDRNADLHAVLVEYARLFFGCEAAETAAAGLFALEKNWEGPLALNGSVDAAHSLWSGLEKRFPNLSANWRWQMYLLRANYDLFIRHRLLYETKLEAEANAAMLKAAENGASNAAAEALSILKRTETHPVRTDLADKITHLCNSLFSGIGLQTSVAKHKASGLERGCVLDFLHYPLNNRWWLEDELSKLPGLKTEKERVERLRLIATWENSGPGSFYDDIGNIAKSPHEVRNEKLAAPLLDVDNMPGPGLMFWVEKDPLARARQSWMTDESWPVALKYTVDPKADYILRTTGMGDCLLRVNGVRIPATLDGRKIGEFKEFPIPRGLLRDGTLTVTFDPTFEPQLNWRVQSRLTEIWLLRR
jgi:hypothetical protein